MGGNIYTHENFTKLVCCEGSKPHLQPVAISHNRANLGIVLMQNNATPHWLNNTTDDVEA